MEDYKKKYEEALENFKKIKAANKDNKELVNFIEYEYPELKESEDERIRKHLIKHFGNKSKEDWNGVPVKSILAWLEKQGEQKEINLVEILKHYPRETELYSPLYGKLWLAEVDEEHKIITCYKYKLKNGCTRAVLEQEDTVSFYSNGTTGLPDFNVSKDCMLFLYNNEKQGEQKPIDKVEHKFNVGDEIKTPKEESLTITKIDEKGYWSEDLFICGFDEECVWDLVEQKPDWSEEDERIKYNLIKYCGLCRSMSCCSRDRVDEAIAWLKSLKDRYTWKPSDEQMEALNDAVKLYKSTHFDSYHYKIETLYEDLKKLKGE